MDLLIRPYAEGDFDPVTKLWLDSFQSSGLAVAASVDLESLRARWIEIAGGWTVHVAVSHPIQESGDLIAGFAALARNDELSQLFVAPDFQGRGVGKQLLDFVKGLRPWGFWLTTAVDNAAGRRFYEREGLVEGPLSISARLGHQLIRYDWRPDHRGASISH